MGIGENIKLLRDKHDLTQQDIADITGVSNKAVSTWENGTKEPRMGAVQKLADHFGIKKSQLIEDGGLEDISTIAAHHENSEWTEDELEELENFKHYLRSKRKK